jgi:hypothetical protein
MDNAVVLYAGRWPPKLKLARAVLQLHNANFVRPFALKVVVASFDPKPFACDPHRDAHDLSDLVIETFGRDAVHAVRTFGNRSGHDVYGVASIPNFASVKSHPRIASLTRGVLHQLSSWYFQYSHLRTALELAGDKFDIYVRARPDWRPAPASHIHELRIAAQWMHDDNRNENASNSRPWAILFEPWCPKNGSGFQAPVYDYVFLANWPGMLHATDANILRVPEVANPHWRCEGMCPEELLLAMLHAPPDPVNVLISAVYQPAFYRWPTRHALNCNATSKTLMAPPHASSVVAQSVPLRVPRPMVVPACRFPNPDAAWT